MEKTKTAKEIQTEFDKTLLSFRVVLENCGNDFFEYDYDHMYNKLIFKTNFGVFGFDNIEEVKAWTSGVHFAVWNKLKFKKGRGNA